MFLVTGGKGGLGTSLKNIVSKNKKFIFCDVDELDITDIDIVEKFFEHNKIEFIYHYAAYTDVDKAELEKEKCYEINVTGTKNITKMSIKYNIPILLISTDYVFNGKRPIDEYYTEVDKPDPINYYGYTKYLSELEIMKNPKYYIVRSEWLYGDTGNNFIKGIVAKLKSNTDIKIVDDQFGSITYNDTLNKIILLLTVTNKYGIYNITNSGYASRFEIVKFIAEYFNYSGRITNIKSDEIHTNARRPQNSKLSLEKIESLLNIKINHWKSDLKFYVNYKA